MLQGKVATGKYAEASTSFGHSGASSIISCNPFTVKKARRSDSEDRSSSSLSGGSRSLYSEENATAITVQCGKDEESDSGNDDEDDNHAPRANYRGTDAAAEVKYKNADEYCS